MRTHALECSLQHCLQLQNHGINPNAHQSMSRKRNCGKDVYIYIILLMAAKYSITYICFIYIYMESSYIYIMAHYAAIKRNELTAFAVTWMRLETIILSEVTQEWKTKYHIFSLNTWEPSYEGTKL